MDEIKIWEIDSSKARPIPAGGLESERTLEETLVHNPDLLMPGLRLIGRQTPTEGGPLDLIGVDDDGKLVVFELKKEAPSRDAVAQIIDYASYLNSLDDDTLAHLVARHSGQRGIERIDDFVGWYGENTNGDSLESLRPVRMVLVGLGVDHATERMVSFLSNTGHMDISLLTFYGFRQDGRTLLARQAPSSRDRRRRLSRDERRTRIVDRAKEHGVYDLLL